MIAPPVDLSDAARELWPAVCVGREACDPFVLADLAEAEAMLHVQRRLHVEEGALLESEEGEYRTSPRVAVISHLRRDLAALRKAAPRALAAAATNDDSPSSKWAGRLAVVGGAGDS